MVTYILGFLDILAITALLIGYFVLFIPILGVDETKRNPLLSIASLVIIYLESLACSYFWPTPAVRVVIAVLIGGLLLALVASFLSDKEGSPLHDFISFVVFTLGSVYILYPVTYIKLFAIAKNAILNHDFSDNTFLLVMTLLLGLIIIGLSITYMSRLKKRVNSLDYQLYSTVKRLKQNDNIQSFSEPYQNYLYDEIREMIEQMKKDVVDEVRLSNYESTLGPVYMPTDELTRLAREVKNLRKIIKKEARKQEDFSVDDFVSDMKHSLMTPLSQILSNCELLEDELSSSSSIQKLERVEKNVKICQSMLNSYKEVVSVSKPKTFIGLQDAFNACLESAEKECGKKIKEIKYGDGFVESIEAYSNNVLIGLVAPLINNAVAASPNDAVIEMSIVEKDDFYRLSISNVCEADVPTLIQLNTTGYSSKNNHQGVGLSTVRNLVRLMKSAELSFEIDDNKVTVVIVLKKRV